MTRVGFIGLGKLGLPCAAALSSQANRKVNGFDINPAVRGYIDTCKVPYQEARIEEFLKSANLEFFDSIEDFLDDTDLVFVAVQTPHEPQFEGATPVPNETRDFDYKYLEDVSTAMADWLANNPERSITVVIISTVLPGTMEMKVLPKFSEVRNRLKFCYNPFFIAMGTTIPDYLNPEFVLLGEANPGDGDEVIALYQAVHDAPVRKMKIESAELTKVAYNTFIGFKIVFANTLAEIVDNRGGDVDEVTQALASANQRLISGKYLSAGMADGGGCHPRDQIAMSWLAKEAGLSANVFEFLAKARDQQTKAQASLIAKLHNETGLPVCILGVAYKADVNLTVGSPSLLLGNFLDELSVQYSRFDPLCLPLNELPTEPSLFFVATNHSAFQRLTLPEKSIVVDPWGGAVPESSTWLSIKPGRMSKN